VALPHAAYPQTVTCPACDGTVLLAAGARQGGTPVPFDPEPRIGDHYDTRLADDLSHVIAPASATANLSGRIVMHRGHFWSCPAGLRVPAGRTCPSWAGYSQAAAAGKTGPPAEPVSWPQPWQGIRGVPRDTTDLLSLDKAAMPRRRQMAAMALALWRATLAGQMTPEAVRMGKRIREPVPGDLVVEVSTAAKPGSERRGFGILLVRRREWVSAEAEYSLAMDSEPDEMTGGGSQGTGEAIYIQYGQDIKEIARWQDGQFITAPADESGH